MSFNVSWVSALRTIVVVSLLFALVCAMLGSIGLNGRSFNLPDSAGAPEVPSQPPSGIHFDTTVPR